MDEDLSRAIADAVAAQVTAEGAGVSERERLARALWIEFYDYASSWEATDREQWLKSADAILAAGFGDVAGVKAQLEAAVKDVSAQVRARTAWHQGLIRAAAEHRTVTTAAERDALPVGTITLDAHRNIHSRDSVQRIWHLWHTRIAEVPALPFVILHQPTDANGASE